MADEIELNNPAGRLHYWLKRGDDVRLRDQNMSALTAWSEVFALDHKDRADQAECFRRGMALIDAGVQTRLLAEELAETNPMAPVALENFQQVEASLAFFASLGRSTVGEFYGQMTETAWYGLRMLDTLLSHERPEAWVDDHELEVLVSQTRDLLDRVVAADGLSQEEKQQIIKSLRDVEEALIRVQVTGGADLERAVDGMIGSLFRVIMVKGVGFVQHPVTQAVLGLATAVALALQMGADYTAIANTGIGEFLHLPSPGPTSGLTTGSGN